VNFPGKSDHRLFTAALMVAAVALCVSLSSCSSPDRRNSVIISVKDQKMLVVHNNVPIKSYPISTSKFGTGDRRGSNCTPLGHLEVARKIGRGAPAGAVFKGRKRTGETIKPNAPGRDPIVSRIIWLSGKERNNRNAFRRYIYIHGTPEERTIGHPRSYGCIRMKSRDIINLHRELAVGSRVDIIKGPLTSTALGKTFYHIDEPSTSPTEPSQKIHPKKTPSNRIAQASKPHSNTKKTTKTTSS
jgi:hypothetical protein